MMDLVHYFGRLRLVFSIFSAAALHNYALGRGFGPAIQPLLDATFYSAVFFDLAVSIAFAGLLVYGIDALLAFFGLIIADVGFSIGLRRTPEAVKWLMPFTTRDQLIGIGLLTVINYLGATIFATIAYMAVGAIGGRALGMGTDILRSRKRGNLNSDVGDAMGRAAQNNLKFIRGPVLNAGLTFCLLFGAWTIGSKKAEEMIESQVAAELIVGKKNVVVGLVGRTSLFLLHRRSDSDLNVYATPYTAINEVRPADVVVDEPTAE